jgi:hypothetical protein
MVLWQTAHTMRSQLRSLASCAALGASFFAPCLARADEPPDPDPSRASPTEQDKATAADLRARADKAFNDGDFRAALPPNLAAYRLTGDRSTACNAGLLARKLAADSPPDAHGEHYELAAELLERCTAELPTSTEEQRKRAAPYFRALELTRLELGAVRVIVTDPGAEVRIGGRVLGHGPIDVTAYVREGMHEVAATRGTATERRQVQVQKRGAYTVMIESSPVAEPAPQGPTPAPPPLVPRRAEPLPMPPSRPDSLVIAGSVTSSGAAVGAAVLFGVSGVRQAEADEARREAEGMTGMGCFQSYRAPAQCRAYRQETGIAQSLMSAGFVSLGGAVLTGAATLVYALTNPKRDPKATTTVAPRGLGMVVQWR